MHARVRAGETAAEDSDLQQALRDFAEFVRDTVPLKGPIYEFGALQVPGQEGFADLRSLFSAHPYVGTDMRAGPGVDRILDLHELDLPDETVGTAVCLDTFEHVEEPRKAAAELHRVLRPDGVLILSSVMDFPIHNYPHDYWRFTPEAFRSLLREFSHAWVGWAGRDEHPHTVIAVGFKRAVPDLSALQRRYELWQRKQRLEPRYVVTQWTPPALLKLAVGTRGLIRRVTGR